MTLPDQFKRTVVIAVDLHDCIEADGAWSIYNREELLRSAKTALRCMPCSGAAYCLYTELV